MVNCNSRNLPNQQIFVNISAYMVRTAYMHRVNVCKLVVQWENVCTELLEATKFYLIH